MAKSFNILILIEHKPQVIEVPIENITKANISPPMLFIFDPKLLVTSP